MIVYRIKFLMSPSKPILVWDEHHNGTVVVEDTTTSKRSVNNREVNSAGEVVATTFDMEEATDRGEREILLEDLGVQHLMKYDGKFHRVVGVERLSFPPGITKEQAQDPEVDDASCPFPDCEGTMILCPIHKDSFPGVSVLYCPHCDMSFSICDYCGEVVPDIFIVEINTKQHEHKYCCKECAQKHAR